MEEDFYALTGFASELFLLEEKLTNHFVLKMHKTRHMSFCMTISTKNFVKFSCSKNSGVKFEEFLNEIFQLFFIQKRGAQKQMC